MEIFEQNGREVFIITNIQDMFMVRPKHARQFINDFATTYSVFNDFVMRIAVMNKMMNLGKEVPGEKMIWIADPTMSPFERVQLVVRERPNDEGGSSLGTISAKEIIQIQETRDKMRPIIEGLREMFGKEIFGEDETVDEPKTARADDDDDEDCTTCQHREYCPNSDLNEGKETNEVDGIHAFVEMLKGMPGVKVVEIGEDETKH